MRSARAGNSRESFHLGDIPKGEHLKMFSREFRWKRFSDIFRN